jgi:hypothetical protein
MKIYDLEKLKQKITQLTGRIQSIEAQNELPSILQEIMEELTELEYRMRYVEEIIERDL